MSNKAAEASPRTQISILAVLLLILVIAFGGWKYLSDRFGPPGTHQHGNVAIPPASTTPTAMVLAFVDALNVCDHKTIRALTAADYTSSATVWCNNGIHDVHVADSTLHGASGGVDLTFKVRHSDGSLPSGTVHETFAFERSADGTRWAVFSDGQTGS